MGFPAQRDLLLSAQRCVLTLMLLLWGWRLLSQKVRPFFLPLPAWLSCSQGHLTAALGPSPKVLFPSEETAVVALSKVLEPLACVSSAWL